MKHKMRNGVCLIVLLLVCAVGIAPGSANANVMYESFVKDSFDNRLTVQPPYQPVGYVGNQIMIDDPDNPGQQIPSPMNNPSDVFIDADDRIYIADTGNNRILVFEPAGKLSLIITLEESPFKQPQGIFVTDDTGEIYIADTGNKRVVKLDRQGRLLQTFTAPQSPFIPEGYKFDPIKLVVDKRGFLFVATLGGYQGLLQLDPEGKFAGFFGPNTIQMSPLDKIIDNIKKTIYSEEMLSNELSQLPGSIDNVAIDTRGFVYTVTKGVNITKQQIKKLNIKGKNLIAKEDDVSIEHSWKRIGMKRDPRKFGDFINYQVLQRGNDERLPQLIDVAVDSYGNMATIDSNYRNVSFYDADGNLLFFWLGSDSIALTQLGLQRSPTALAFNSRNELFILDNKDNLLGKFTLTSFGGKVLEANAFTAEGRYEEASSLWKEVLHYNSGYPPAIIGLARAEYQRENYDEALRLFHLGKNQYEYSNTFWQLRLQWFYKHFSTVASLLLLGGMALWIGQKFVKRSRLGVLWRNRKRTKLPFLLQLRHVFYLLKHPVDGFTAIRYENKGGYASALLLLILASASKVLTDYYTSFSFNKIDQETLQAAPILMQFLLIWIVWVVCNYLIGSIMRGEARFKDVFVGSSYALTPMILFSIPLAALSNVMTLSELTIYYFMYYAIVIWTGLMFVWKVQALQNYSVGETFINIFVTLFAMVMVGVMVFLIYSLSSQFIQFVLSIYREVILR